MDNATNQPRQAPAHAQASAHIPKHAAPAPQAATATAAAPAKSPRFVGLDHAKSEHIFNHDDSAKGGMVPKGQQTQNAQSAAKKLTVKNMVVYGLIQMVPIAPFAIYASVYNASCGMPAMPYLIGFLGMLFTVFSFAVMIPLFPSSGSIYTYCSRAITPVVGFIAGWLMLMQYLITPDLMFIQAGLALNQFVKVIPVWGWCLMFLAFVAFMSMRSLKNIIRIDMIALVAELIVFGTFIVLGIIYIIQHPENSSFSLKNFFNPENFKLSGMMDAVTLCAMSFVGFGCVATLTEEAENPRKGPGNAMLIIVIILGIMFVGMCYITSCINCKIGQPPAMSQAGLMKDHPDNGFYILANLVGGGWYGTVCAVANALALGIFTGLAATVSISRVIYVMSRSGALPKQLGIMDKKNNVPISATIFVNVLSLAMLFFLIQFGMTAVAKLSNFGALSTYCLLNIAVIWYCFIKKKEKLNLWRALVLPLCGAIVTGAIFFSIEPKVAFLGWIWVVFGIIYYLVATRIFKKEINLG